MRITSLRNVINNVYHDDIFNALSEPMALPARDIAKKMGLDIQEVHITKYCSIFG